MAKKWPFLTILLGKWRYFGSKMAQKGGNMTVFLGHFWVKKLGKWRYFGSKRWEYDGLFAIFGQKGGNMTVFLAKNGPFYWENDGILGQNGLFWPIFRGEGLAGTHLGVFYPFFEGKKPLIACRRDLPPQKWVKMALFDPFWGVFPPLFFRGVFPPLFGPKKSVGIFNKWQNPQKLKKSGGNTPRGPPFFRKTGVYPVKLTFWVKMAIFDPFSPKNSQKRSFLAFFSQNSLKWSLLALFYLKIALKPPKTLKNLLKCPKTLKNSPFFSKILKKHQKYPFFSINHRKYPLFLTPLYMAPSIFSILFPIPQKNLHFSKSSSKNSIIPLSGCLSSFRKPLGDYISQKR